MPDTMLMKSPTKDKPDTSPDAHPSRRAGDHGLLESEKLADVDRLANATTAKLTMGLSPVSLAMTWFDWAVHLATSPGKQFELAEKAVRKTTRFNEYAVRCLFGDEPDPCIEPLLQDKRFDHETWQIFPYNLANQAFLLNQQWWHNATTNIRGVSQRHEQAVEFFSRQILDTVAPSNSPFLNPEIIRTTFEEGGENLKRGARNWWDDVRRKAKNEPPAGAEAFKVGENLAITPGKVVLRNHLMELIQYEPSTTAVHREPILMQSAWMMKYYIMDLSRRNSLVKYLVDRGHTVFMISWRNPGAEDRDLGMEDYRRLGTMAAIDAISEIVPDEKIHAVGYCLGGILLTIAAAKMARDGDDRLASVTLFTTLVDFTEVGEMGIFMDTSQITFMDDMMWERGYLDPQMAHGSFQLLKSRDLIWSKMIREYWLGEREKMFDLMAWNSDGTRMPYRQHSELLRRLYHDNELFHGRYKVEGRPIRISDIHIPIFCVAAEKDHVAPWISVYKLHLQSDATTVTFVLTSGGHNVGIVNEPGHPRRFYRMTTHHAEDRVPDADTWYANTEPTQGSWWPAWQMWLAEQSHGRVPARDVGAPGYRPLCDAPGTYVLMT